MTVLKTIAYDTWQKVDTAGADVLLTTAGRYLLFMGGNVVPTFASSVGHSIDGCPVVIPADVGAYIRSPNHNGTEVTASRYADAGGATANPLP